MKKTTLFQSSFFLMALFLGACKTKVDKSTSLSQLKPSALSASMPKSSPESTTIDARPSPNDLSSGSTGRSIATSSPNTQSFNTANVVSHCPDEQHWRIDAKKNCQFKSIYDYCLDYKNLSFELQEIIDLLKTINHSPTCQSLQQASASMTELALAQKEIKDIYPLVSFTAMLTITRGSLASTIARRFSSKNAVNTGAGRSSKQLKLGRQ